MKKINDIDIIINNKVYRFNELNLNGNYFSVSSKDDEIYYVLKKTFINTKNAIDCIERDEQTYCDFCFSSEDEESNFYLCLNFIRFFMDNKLYYINTEEYISLLEKTNEKIDECRAKLRLPELSLYDKEHLLMICNKQNYFKSGDNACYLSDCKKIIKGDRIALTEIEYTFIPYYDYFDEDKEYFDILFKVDGIYKTSNLIDEINIKKNLIPDLYLYLGKSIEIKLMGSNLYSKRYDIAEEPHDFIVPTPADANYVDYTCYENLNIVNKRDRNKINDIFCDLEMETFSFEDMELVDKR